MSSYEGILRFSSSARRSARPLCSALPELRCRRAAAGVPEACRRVVSERWSHQLRRPLCLTRHDGQCAMDCSQSVWHTHGKVGNRSRARSLCARWMSFAPHSTLRPPEHACVHMYAMPHMLTSVWSHLASQGGKHSSWAYFVAAMSCRALGCVVWLQWQLRASCFAARRSAWRESDPRGDPGYTVETASRGSFTEWTVDCCRRHRSRSRRCRSQASSFGVPLGCWRVAVHQEVT